MHITLASHIIHSTCIVQFCVNGVYCIVTICIMTYKNYFNLRWLSSLDMLANSQDMINLCNEIHIC